jgi:hypothetical protein
MKTITLLAALIVGGCMPTANHPRGEVGGGDGGSTVGGSGLDGGGDGGGGGSSAIVTCGGSRCRAGQSCSASGCAFPCSGVNVPGDYATVQAAFTAIATPGGTICLGAGTFDESASLTPYKDVTIIGVSPELTILRNLQIDLVQHIPTKPRVTVRGLGITQGAHVGPLDVSFESSTIANPTTEALTVVASGGGPDSLLTFTVTVEGCDLSAMTQALYVTDWGGSAATIRVANSWIHDSMIGVLLNPLGSGSSVTTTANHSVTLVNDTFTHDAVGLDATETPLTRWGLVYANDLFAGSDVAVRTHAAVTTSSNGFSGNMTNFDGDAVPGPGDVRADAQIDESLRPPALGAGSPDRGAGDSKFAPGTDYWGAPRPAKPDIGAMQSP